MRITNSRRWQLARAAAKARDHHRCRNCGSDRNLQVHHVVRLIDGGAPFDLRNLRTRCRRCHRFAHGGQASIANEPPITARARFSRNTLRTGPASDSYEGDSRIRGHLGLVLARRRDPEPLARDPMSSGAQASPTSLDKIEPAHERGEDGARSPCDLDGRSRSRAGSSRGAHERHPAKGPLGSWPRRWLLARASRGPRLLDRPVRDGGAGTRSSSAGQ